ncbi:lytic murein transglycosylase [Nocardia sp. NPDC052316]|uniref:lytic transglycosylase domain-containing protein n=1 Tax=Nocardia sp. NPDC052316 TaxID=3364329 RepID=UPI0037C63A1D
MSALVLTGLVLSGSAAHTTPRTTDGLLASSIGASDPGTDQSIVIGPEPTQQQLMTPPIDEESLVDGTVPLHNVDLPNVPTRGIPEIALAAYRNAELSLQSSTPNCGMSWHLLAGIGKIESNHAGNGRTDAEGTTRGIIYGPALDGTLPGNEIIPAAEGGYVRAVGPMQFLPGTWAIYAADGNGDRNTDPNNIFDAVLGAGKYLCSGDLDMRDQKQELRAVLRYNNSLEYASKVLSWSNAYKTGGAPAQGELAPIPDSTPDGGMPEGAGSSMSVGETVVADPAAPPEETPAPEATPDPPPADAPDTTVTTVPQNPRATLQLKIRVTINIPGRAPIPCGIFCPPSALPKPPPIPVPTSPSPRPTTQTTTPTTTPSTTTPTTVAPTTRPPAPAPSTTTQSTTQQPIAPPPATTDRKPPPTTPKPTTQAPPKPPAPQQSAPPPPPQQQQATPPPTTPNQQPAAPATPAPRQPAPQQQPTPPPPPQQPAAPAPSQPITPQPPPAPAPAPQPAAPPATKPQPTTPVPVTPASKQPAPPAAPNSRPAPPAAPGSQPAPPATPSTKQPPANQKPPAQAPAPPTTTIQPPTPQP